MATGKEFQIGYFEIESLHHSLATLGLLQLIDVIFFVKMQRDTNTITQSLIYYFNSSNFCRNKVSKFTMKFSYLISRKIVKIVTTRGQICRRKCIKFDFGCGWGYTPDPAGGDYSSQTP